MSGNRIIRTAIVGGTLFGKVATGARGDYADDDGIGGFLPGGATTTSPPACSFSHSLRNTDGRDVTEDVFTRTNPSLAVVVHNVVEDVFQRRVFQTSGSMDVRAAKMTH